MIILSVSCKWFFLVIIPSDSSLWLFQMILPCDSSKWFLFVIIPSVSSKWFFQVILPSDYYYYCYISCEFFPLKWYFRFFLLLPIPLFFPSLWGPFQMHQLQLGSPLRPTAFSALRQDPSIYHSFRFILFSHSGLLERQNPLGFKFLFLAS